MHDCTFASHRTEAHLCLCHFSSPSFIRPPCPLFHYVVMKLTKVLPSFTAFSSIYVRSIRSTSFSPSSSPSVLYLCPVMQLTANLSSSLILSSSSSSTLFLFASTASFILTLYLLFPRLLLPLSFPCLCATGHAANNKGKQVAAGHQVDSHGTLSL